MVLAYLGWNGEPDDITRRFGKDAQSPAGLAEVFNAYVSTSDSRSGCAPQQVVVSPVYARNWTVVCLLSFTDTLPVRDM